MELTLSLPVRVGALSGFAFLAAATLGALLFRFLKPQNQTGRKVLRIIGGWWIITVLIGFAILLGERGVIFLFLITSLLGLKEFLMVRRSEFLGMPALVVLSLLTVAHYLFILLAWKNFFLFIVPVMTFIYLPFFFLLRRKIGDLIHSLWTAQSAVMLCVYFLSFVPGIQFLNVDTNAGRALDPIAAFLFLFFVTELNDVFQFTAGKLLGKIKVVPEISPNKTLAGFLGGIVCSTGLACLIGPPFLGITMAQGALTGACLSLAGMSGDLMFSAVKRTYGVKDFSDLIPGHGGVLDRVDSLVFTAPTLYCLLYIFIH